MIKRSLFKLVPAVAITIVLMVSGTADELKAETVKASKRVDPVTFSVTAARIKDAALSDERLWIKLDEKGRLQFLEVTRAEMWNQMHIVILGYPALRFTVVHEIDNGRLVIKEPEAALVKALESHLK